MDAGAWTALVGATIGGAGAVLVQGTAAFFTARRDAAKFDWDREKQQRDWKLEESSRFREVKHGLYAEFLCKTYDPTAELVDVTREEYVQNPDWQERVPRYVGNFQAEVDSCRWRVQLISSPIVVQALECYNARLLVALIMAASANKYSINERHAYARRTLESWQDLSAVMRHDLAGNEEAAKACWERATKRMTPSVS